MFGTPAEPKKTDLLALANRGINEAGDAYTNVINSWVFTFAKTNTEGTINLSVNDLTARDTPFSRDKATMEAEFKGPDGEDFRVVLKKIHKEGPYEHEVFGGVATNVLLHGTTGRGTPFVPREFSYIVIWGEGDLYRNGELIDSDLSVFVEVSQRASKENFKMRLNESEFEEVGMKIHLVLFASVTKDSGNEVPPMKTGIILPDGKEQPFIHVNFIENIKITGNELIY